MTNRQAVRPGDAWIVDADGYVVGVSPNAHSVQTTGLLREGRPATVTTLTATDGVVLPKTSALGIKVDTDTPTFPWQDLIGVLRPDTAGANTPTLDTVRAGACREFFYSAGDKMDMNFHIPHDYLPGSDLFIHMHWMHNGTAISGNMVATFASTYAKGHAQAIFPAEKAVTISVSTPNIATIPQYSHRIDEVAMTSDAGSATLWANSLIEPDGIILVNMTVTTIPTITGGARNEPCVFFADIHYQSTGIGTKQKAPDFYT